MLLVKVGNLVEVAWICLHLLYESLLYSFFIIVEYTFIKYVGNFKKESYLYER